MKRIILSAIVIGLAFQSNAQDRLYQAKLKVEDMPEVVVSAIAIDFPDYTVIEYVAVPIEYVEEEIYLNPDIDSWNDYDTFQVRFSGKGGEVVATYDSDGNVVHLTEHLKDTALPIAVRNAIAKEYPNWIISKDRYNMVRYKDGKKRERYRIVLENHGKKIRVHTDAKGKILNHHKLL